MYSNQEESNNNIKEEAGIKDCPPCSHRNAQFGVFSIAHPPVEPYEPTIGIIRQDLIIMSIPTGICRR